MLFKTKVRQVGTSLGMLIPKDIVKIEHIKEGQMVNVSLLKERKLDDLLKKVRGTAKGAAPFEREKEDRIDRW